MFIIEEENLGGERFGREILKTQIQTLAFTASIILSSAAFASIGDWPSEPGYIYTSTTATDLWNAGFDNLTEDDHLVIVPSWCGGCYTSDSVSTGGSLMGFVEIDLTYAPVDAAMGFYILMDIDYTDPSFQFEDMEALIESSDSDINVMSAYEAGTDWSPFTDWLPEDQWDSTIFQWMPSEFDPDSTNPFESTVLTFGWNFSGYTGIVGGSPFPGLVIGDIGVVPAPGALALLLVAGIASRNRRK